MIQFNDWLNSVIDENENKNPYTLIKTYTINDFLSMVLTRILLTMKQHVLKTCKMKMFEIRSIYCHWRVTNVIDSLFPTLSQILYLL